MEFEFIVDTKGTVIVRIKAKNLKEALDRVGETPAEDYEINEYTAIYDKGTGKLIKVLG